MIKFYLFIIMYAAYVFYSLFSKMNDEKSLALVISFSYTIELHHQNEILKSMEMNVIILPVYVYLDGPKDECDRLMRRMNVYRCTYIGAAQPSYYDMVRYASAADHDIIVLSNADIVFDRTIYKSTALTIGHGYAISWSSAHLSNESMCLSSDTPYCALPRHNWVINCWPRRLFSIDSFVFHREDLKKIQAVDGFEVTGTTEQYRMNRPGAEFSFIGVLESNGIDMRNACAFIHTMHYHNSAKSHDDGLHDILYSKYGIYNPQLPFRPIVKKIIYDGIPGDFEFKLPLGIPSPKHLRN